MNMKFDENFRLVITKMRNLVSNSEKINQKTVQKEQSQQADNFLNAGMYELAFKMSQNGYNFTIKQQQQIDTHIFSVIEQKSELWVDILDKYIQQGLSLNTKHVMHMLKTKETDFRKEFLSREVFSNQNESFL